MAAHRQKQVTSRQLQAFKLIMLRGTMTAAAAELHTSQPSISRLIQELEASTGLTLFLRQGGRLQATSVATAFYREVELSFIGLDKLTQSAREIAQFGTGRLRIAAAPVMAINVLPAVIRQFKQQHPNAMVSLEMRSEATIQRWTSSSYCDLGFATVMPETMGMHIEPLYSTPGWCALPKKHALAGKSVIQARDLAYQSLILPSYADATRSHLDRAFYDAEVEWMASIETPYGSTICSLVNEGLGIGLVNPLATVAQTLPNTVFRRFIPDILFSGYAICPENNQSSPLVQLFLRLTREHIQRTLANIQIQ